MASKLTKEQFIQKSQLVHGDKYDYSLVDYVNAYTKIKIICPSHGVFDMRPDSHLSQKQGCPACYNALRGKSRQAKAKSVFIDKANQIHNNKYDYSQTVYVKSSDKVIINCPIHGSYLQRPNEHLKGKGCWLCGVNNRTSDTEAFIAKAREIHGDKYTYEHTVYTYSKDKDKNSWMYHRFNTISILDNKFYENYAFGGPYLSIVKDDDLGAKDIYDKGLKIFPMDYELNFNSGFHYYFELHDPKGSLVNYNRLLQFSNTPPHLRSFIAKINSSHTTLEDSYAIIKDLFEKYKHIDFFKQRYEDNLYAIRAEIDLECLNAKKSQQCNTVDYFKTPYIIKNGQYIAQRSWTPFRERNRQDKKN